MKKVLIKKIVGVCAVAAASLAGSPAMAVDIMARVISSTPVVHQVAIPRQVCNNEVVTTQAPKSGAGALMGGLAGGAVGNAIGNGNGRVIATMLGVVGGAIFGDRIEGSNNQVQNVQNCTTQTFYENRPSHYNVLYDYQGTQYNVQMATDPGPYVRLQVTPVGAIAPLPQPMQPLQAQQPQAYIQPAPARPVYIQQQTYVQPYVQPYIQPAYTEQTYVQPVMVAPTVIYPASPGYYSRPYYAPSHYSPSYAPIGLSLNLGYSRGFGGHRHWR